MEELNEKNKKEKTNGLNIKDFFNKNKKMIIVAIVILIIVVIVIIGVSSLFGESHGATKEDVLTTKAEELVKHFYVETYYPNLVNPETHELMTEDERKEYAARYATTGISLNLNNLARTSTEDSATVLKEFVDDDGNPCDYEKSKVVIYPVGPYGATDYKVEVSLECGFKEEK